MPAYQVNKDIVAKKGDVLVISEGEISVINKYLLKDLQDFIRPGSTTKLPPGYRANPDAPLSPVETRRNMVFQSIEKGNQVAGAGVSAAAISSATGVPRTTLIGDLNVLLKANLIRCEGRGRKACYVVVNSKGKKRVKRKPK